MKETGARQLRLVLFGSASRYSQLALEQLALDQRVAALVLPVVGSALRRAMRGLAGRPRSAIEEAAVRLGIPVVHSVDTQPTALSERLLALRPDVLCIALYPRLLPRVICEIAPLGAVNAHPSWLPRHRGPLPLLWNYLCDDKEAGVTIHHANERFDAGDIIIQSAVPLPRAYPIAQLDRDVARSAATLLGEAMHLFAAGRATRVAQDEGAATYAPLIRPGMACVNFDVWDAERVHHVLSGLCLRHREPLRDDEGRAVAYNRVTGYVAGDTGMQPGVIERTPGGWTLYCRGGRVLLT